MSTPTSNARLFKGWRSHNSAVIVMQTEYCHQTPCALTATVRAKKPERRWPAATTQDFAAASCRQFSILELRQLLVQRPGLIAQLQRLIEQAADRVIVLLGDPADTLDGDG